MIFKHYDQSFVWPNPCPIFQCPNSVFRSHLHKFLKRIRTKIIQKPSCRMSELNCPIVRFFQPEMVQKFEQLEPDLNLDANMQTVQILNSDNSWFFQVRQIYIMRSDEFLLALRFISTRIGNKSRDDWWSIEIVYQILVQPFWDYDHNVWSESLLNPNSIRVCLNLEKLKGKKIEK